MARGKRQPTTHRQLVNHNLQQARATHQMVRVLVRRAREFRAKADQCDSLVAAIRGGLLRKT